MSRFKKGDRVQIVSSHPVFKGKKPFGRIVGTGAFCVVEEEDGGRRLTLPTQDLLHALPPVNALVPPIPVQRDRTHNEDDARGLTQIPESLPRQLAMHVKRREDAALLSTGAAIVEERGQDYGHPTRNFYRIAGLWSAIIGTEVTPHDVALMMIAMKISREKSSHKEDNLVDMEGYVHCLRLLTSEGTTSAEEVGTTNEVTREV